jgi:acyl-CoA reductase-like NAD-dependent aldehyde dehydrogenase
MDVQLLIGGQDMAAASRNTFERANPVTGELVPRSAAAGPEDAIRAADAAAAAFPAWSGLGPNARRRILLKAAEVLLSKMDEFKGVMAAETGITAGIAENEVRIGADMLVEAASLTVARSSRQSILARYPWPSGKRPASASASRLGTVRSASACGRSPSPWLAATP